jgi:hypothetical protein
VPRLADETYRITSPEDPEYNCFAWAANDNTQVWSPTMLGSGVYWPPGIPALANMNGVLDAYVMTGYERCESPDAEDGFEKIAIFADASGDPRHAARQLPTGSWASKLGDHVDIEHDNLAAVGGDLYGEPAVFMKRPIEPPAAHPIRRLQISVPGVDRDVARRLADALARRPPAYELLAPPASAEDTEDDAPEPTTGPPELPGGG